MRDSPARPHPDGFQSDLLPSQWLVGPWHATAHTGERRLMVAILADAIDACCRPSAGPRPTRRAERLRREAESWIESDDVQSLYSFERICQHLHIDADYLRRGVRLWAEPARFEGALGESPRSNAPRTRPASTPYLRICRPASRSRWRLVPCTD
jgi:hypothetical protein